MAPLSFTPQQQQAIQTYRQQNNIASIISDEAVVDMIKQQGGQTASIFQSSGYSWSAGQTNLPSQNTGRNETIFDAKKNNNQSNNVNKNTTSKNTPSPAQTLQQKQNAELQALGLQNTEGAGGKFKAGNGNEYTVVGAATNGRTIVKDSKGNFQVVAQDGTLLNKDYVIKSNTVDNIRHNNKIAQNTTIQLMQSQMDNAQEAFDAQLAKDGWAADVADGVSNLWGWAQKDGNQAWRVRKDLKAYNKNITDLQKAAQQGDAQFNAKFKEIYGIDYNQNAMVDYVNNPTQENYQKAFGTKNNITERVQNYNNSQDTGAVIVKGTATVAAGVAVGVATGGVGLAAVGVAAAGTAASSAAINVSDRLSSDVGLQDGEMTEIMKNAAWDGASVLAGGAVGKIAGTAIKGATTAAKAGRAAVSAAGDTAIGAAQEYAETGQVTAAGTALNAALGGVGIAAESGALTRVGQKIKNSISPEAGGSTIKTPDTTPANVQTTGNPPHTTDTPATTTQTNSSTSQTTETPAVQNMSEQAQPAASSTTTTKPAESVQTETSQTNATADKAQTQPELSAGNTNKPDFKHGIMSNNAKFEANLKNADLNNPEVRQSFIDGIAEEFPEFAKYPRKQKTLSQLQALVNHPDYANLSDVNKTMAKLSILKDNGIEAGSLYSKNKVPISIKRRISDIEYCLDNQVDKKSAAALYHDGDYETFKILNDVKNPQRISDEELSQMDGFVNQAKANGNFMVKQSHLTNPKQIPTQTISKNGREYNVKVIDLTDANVMSHLDNYGFEAGTTADNLRLTVHMNDDINKSPQMTVRRMMNSKDLNLSATMTDGTNHLYGDMQIGILLDYDQGAVSYASNYAAGTGFVKDKTNFAKSKLKETESSADTFIKDRFIENMKAGGVEISDEDYVALSNMFKDKKMTAKQLENMSDNGTLTVNGKEFSTEQIQNALDKSTDDLLTMQAEINGKKFKKGFNEINVYNPEIKALYIRDNSADGKLEDILSDKLLQFAQDNNIPIVFQRNVIDS